MEVQRLLGSDMQMQYSTSVGAGCRPTLPNIERAMRFVALAQRSSARSAKQFVPVTCFRHRPGRQIRRLAAVRRAA